MCYSLKLCLPWSILPKVQLSSTFDTELTDPALSTSASRPADRLRPLISRRLDRAVPPDHVEKEKPGFTLKHRSTETDVAVDTRSLGVTVMWKLNNSSMYT